MKTRFTAVPPQHRARLREHVVRSPESSRAEKLEALGRDEKGRIKPLTPTASGAGSDGGRDPSKA